MGRRRVQLQFHHLQLELKLDNDKLLYDHHKLDHNVDRDNHIDIQLNVYHELDDHIYDHIDIHVQQVLNININIKCDFEL